MNVKYRPLDYTLSLPSVRVLRALRHFDDASVVELQESLTGCRRTAIWNALGDHVEGGRVERISHHRYRITDAGRAWLKEQIDRGEVKVTPSMRARVRDAARGGGASMSATLDAAINAALDDEESTN